MSESEEQSTPGGLPRELFIDTGVKSESLINGRYVLTQELAFYIKQEYLTCFEMSLQDLADKYNVSHGALTNLCYNQNWNAIRSAVKKKGIVKMQDVLADPGSPEHLALVEHAASWHLAKLVRHDQLLDALATGISAHINSHDEDGNRIVPPVDTLQKLGPVAIKVIERERKSMGLDNEASANRRPAAEDDSARKAVIVDAVSDALGRLERQPASENVDNPG